MNILMISNMYPTEKYPFYGVFVKNFEDTLINSDARVKRVVLTKSNYSVLKLIKYILYYYKIFFNIVFNKFDIVYVHYISHNSIPLLIAQKFKKFNLWINVHGSDIIPYKKSQFKLQKYVDKIVPSAQRIIVPSNYFKNVVHNRFKVNEEKISIIASGGVNERIFTRLNSQLILEYKESNKISLNKKIIGCICRIEEKKGWDIFLKSIHLLKNQGMLKDKKILFVGDGSEINEFNLLVKKLELESYIIHKKLVSQSELAKIYNSLDVLCFTSLQESLGLIPIECMACGTLVIASDIEPTKEYIINDKSGFLFKQGNYKELSEKIKDFFMIDEEKKISMIKESSLIISKYYTSNVKKEILDIIKA